MYHDPDVTNWPFIIMLVAFAATYISYVVARRRLRRETGRRNRAESHVMILQGAAAEAREAFHRYHDLHIAKGTPEGDKKAKVNLDLGDMMSRALKQTGYVELGPLQQTVVNMARKAERGAPVEL